MARCFTFSALPNSAFHFGNQQAAPVTIPDIAIGAVARASNATGEQNRQPSSADHKAPAVLPWRSGDFGPRVDLVFPIRTGRLAYFYLSRF